MFARGTRRVALANLDLAFGVDLSFAKKKRLVRDSMQTMARTALDMFWFSRHTEERIATWVRSDPMVAEYGRTVPLIGVTAHFGNWEMLGRWLITHGHPIAAVAAPLINPGVERIFNRSRLAGGLQIIPQSGAVRGLLKALKQKKHLALVIDQNVKPADGGLFVNFFGLPVPMSGAPAMFAARTGTPLIVFFCRSCPDGSYLVYANPPFAAESLNGDAGLITQKLAAQFEREIRQHPEQWAWMYKRWKHVPPGHSRVGFPFYAKP